MKCNAPNDIVVLELLEKRDLANGGARHTLILRFESDLLERDDLICRDIFRLVNDTIRA